MNQSAELRVGINGAAGRMGRRLVVLASEDAAVQIVSATEQPDHVDMGKDCGTVAGMGPIGVAIATQMADNVQVLVDFSLPEAVESVLRACQSQMIPLVMATTGLTADQHDALRQTAERVPVVWAPSMSLAVNLAMKLTSVAAHYLKDYGPGADVEIIERHHRFKEDAPSGTAIRFGRLVAEQMGQERHIHGREGRPGQRSRDEIGYHALRTGDNPGEHTIVFGMMGETLEVTVKATNRDCYALGALAAAKFVIDQPPGLYTMNDVLGL